jgi:hypothetical protein
MASVLRVALGRCTCTEPQPDTRRQAVCRTLTERLNVLRAKGSTELERLPSYSEVTETIEGRLVKFETIRESYPGAYAIVVVRAFFHTWSRPTWRSFSGVGHMFADGFVVQHDGTKQAVEEKDMRDFR